jgi:predicted hotdog family 3-hydroxylacyl-ACP dehydratase
MSSAVPAMLVPHQGDALLLESIDTVRSDGLVASLVARTTIPAWMGPEIMAQAISAFATCRDGPPYRPRPGLLLGLRSYRSSAPQFGRGSRLTVDIRESTRDEDGRAVFDSTLSVDGREVATGMLTVFQPADVHAALEEQLA